MTRLRSQGYVFAVSLVGYRTGRMLVFVMCLVVPIEALAESQYEAAVTRMLARLSSDPTMKDALLARLRANCSKRRCRDEDIQTGAQLAANGLRRLDGPTLVTRARLITVILNRVDEKSCAAIVSRVSHGNAGSPGAT